MRSVFFLAAWAVLMALHQTDAFTQSAGSAKKALEAIVKRDFKHAVALVRAIDDPNYRDRSGATLLMCAAEMGAKEVCQALIDKGADPNLRSANGTTALYIAAQNGNTDVVRLLLDTGATTDLRPDNGATPLIVASEYGHDEIVSLLAEKGAGTDMKDNHVMSAVDPWLSFMSPGGKGRRHGHERQPWINSAHNCSPERLWGNS